MSRNNTWGLWAGAALIVVGVVFLLGQFFQVNLMRYLWPFFILAAGAAFFIGMAAGGRSLGALAVPGSVITTIGLILFFQNLFGLWATWTYAWALIIAGAGVGLVIFGHWSQIPDLVRAGRVVGAVGVVLFFAFGLFFELGASLLGMRSPGGIVWAVLLILAGLYVVFGRMLFPNWLDSGPVSRSRMDFDAPPAPDEPGAQGAAAVYPAASGTPLETGLPVAVDTVSGTVRGIRRVHFRALGDLTILQGEREGLEIEGSQAMRERIRTEVRGDLLEIRFDQQWQDWLQPRFWNLNNPLRFTLTVRELDQLEAAGLGDLRIPALRARRFELRQSGTGTLHIRDFQGETLVIQQGGLGNIEIEGRVDTQDVDMSGTGSYHARGLESSTASVRVSGLGSAEVWVKESLDARISGTGSITYYGSPRLAQQVSGLGSVRRLGER